MTDFTSGTLEIEFTAGVWTDVSAYYDLDNSLEITQGRKTEFDDVEPGTLEVSLLNYDGRFMPELPSSPYYPNMVEGKRIRWKVTQSAVTYTRFTGWIMAIDPGFPTNNTARSKVAIFAVDALGQLGQRKLRSNATERALYVARNATSWCDVYEFAGAPLGQYAFATNYSNDASPGSVSAVYSARPPTPSFSKDPDVSIGQVAVFSPDSQGNSNYPIVTFQANPLIVQLMVKMPNDFVGAGVVKSLGKFTTTTAAEYILALKDDGSGHNRLALYDSTMTTNLASILDVPFGQWVHFYMEQNSGTATHLDVWARSVSSGTFGTANLNIDVRTMLKYEPGAAANMVPMSVGSIIAMGVKSPIAEVDSWQAGASGVTTATRITSLQNALSQLPVSFATAGATTSTALATGDWSERWALDVAQEVMRSAGGLLWSRGRDGQIMWVCSDTVRPTAPLVSVDVEADAWGAPSLSRGADTRPTRVEVTFPGGRVVARDTAAEAGGQIRSKSVETICASDTAAQTLGSSLLTQATAGMRLKQLSIDLTAAANDLVADLFSESGALTGLFPTARLRVTNLPLTHFAASTRDYYVQAWREQYGIEGSRVICDTVPAIPQQQYSDTFTGSNGSSFSGSWLAGVTATGGTAQIQSNRGRISSGTVANGYTARRLSGLLAASDQTLLVRFVDSQATARIWARGDSTLAVQGYYVSLDTSGTARLRIMTAGVSTDLATWSFTATTATDYGVRFRVVDRYLLVKTWTGALSAEPGAWSTSAVADTTYSAAAYNGLGVVGDATTTSRAVDFDTITIMDGA